jgi:hypothetical protein
MSFVFPLELLATVFAFLARDTLGAGDDAGPLHDLLARTRLG